ncbi:MAG: 50S ribosomal protein L29 [Anaerolineales bacterium]|jgi:large subunit ribosomal protein L29
MNPNEIRSKSIEEIEELLDNAHEDYFKMRFRLSSGQLPDTSQLNVARRKIARIATILRESELAEVEGGEE